jgi:hypothetical protein
MELKDPANDKVLSYLEQIDCLYPVQSLLSSENEEFSYNNAEYFEEVTYDKFSKPFAEVISDFSLPRQKRHSVSVSVHTFSSP